MGYILLEDSRGYWIYGDVVIPGATIVLYLAKGRLSCNALIIQLHGLAWWVATKRYKLIRTRTMLTYNNLLEYAFIIDSAF